MCLLCKCKAFTKHIELLLNLCSSFPCVFYVFSNTCFNLTGWCEMMPGHNTNNRQTRTQSLFKCFLG